MWVLNLSQFLDWRLSNMRCSLRAKLIPPTSISAFDPEHYPFNCQKRHPRAQTTLTKKMTTRTPFLLESCDLSGALNGS